MKKAIFFISIFMMHYGMVYGDFISDVAFIPTPVYLITNTDNIQPIPFSCYNNQDDAFFVSWHSDIQYENQNYLCYAIYNADGTTLVPTSIIFFNETQPTSDIICCYNSLQNQYFLSWYDSSINTINYAILDNQGSVISSLYTINAEVQWDVFCSFNNVNNQYLLTWVDNSFQGQLAIINQDGSIETTQTIMNYTGTTIQNTQSNVFSCFNHNLNQYFFAWLANDNNVYFSIYNDQGEIIEEPYSLTSSATGTGYYVSISYNSRDYQYILTWLDNTEGNYTAKIAICNQDGSIEKTPTRLIDVSDFATGIYNSYSVQNNQILISFLYTNLETGVILCNASGDVLTSNPPLLPTVSPILYSNGTIFSSYSSISDSFFLSWVISQGALVIYGVLGVSAYSIYFASTLTPPTSLQGKRLFNRFANYGEYYNELSWNPSNGVNIMNYNIYRNNEKIATIPAWQNSYQDHNQPNQEITYSVTSVNNLNDESLPTTISF